MRLTVLNTWGGNMLDNLSDFVRQESRTTDIFCFQEVIDSKEDVIESGETFRGETFNTLNKVLSTFTPYKTKPYTPFGERLAVFVRNDIEVLVDGCEVLIPQQKYDAYSIGSNLQYLTMRTPDGDFVTANVHGLWVKGNKRDTSERIEQSKEILSVLSRFNEPKILCGDFNLEPDTRSIRMLEGYMTNLIRSYRVETTRSTLADKNKSKMSDYLFVSSGVIVKNFSTIDSGASDHLALRLDFDIWNRSRSFG